MAARTYSVLGTGALGGYYGARLARAGRRVRFLLRSDYDHVRKNGLRVDSPEGDFSIAEPEIYDDVQKLPPSDVTLVALKTTSNHLLPDLLPPAATPGSVVLDMQNGLGIEEQIASIVPESVVLGGLAFLCSNKIGPGHICHVDYGGIRLGQYRADGRPAGITPEMQEVARDFRDAGIHADLEEDLAMARWKKLLWNIPYNGLCVVYDTTTDGLMSNPESRRLCRELMEEVQGVAHALGHRVPSPFVDQMLAVTDQMPSYKPSMKLDFERGQALELEALYAMPLRAAKKVGVNCPRIEALYDALRAVDPAGSVTDAGN